MRIYDLPTPALIADNDVIAENMASMAGLLRDRSVRLRPHYKSHKCAALAHRQIASGAVGMTCAKLSEASHGDGPFVFNAWATFSQYPRSIL